MWIFLIWKFKLQMFSNGETCNMKVLYLKKLWNFEGPIRRSERGSEWESIKILLQRENSAYAPKRELGQGSVVTTDLPTLGATPNNPEAQVKLK
jgi:hypothetical protein